MTLKTMAVAAAALAFMALTGCGEQQSSDATEQSPEPEYGTLEFVANGEDFVRNGFVSKDGWTITFRHLYVTLSDVTAYQTEPPYDPHSGEEIQGVVQASLPGIHTVDLARGEGDSPMPVVGTINEVRTGHYNALSWKMTPAEEGPSAGYTIYLDAQAERGDQSYNVFLGFEQSWEYRAGEYVGDHRLGMVENGGTGSLEMTFHFDHIFGDAEQPPDCELNMEAVGFEPFARLMQEGTVEEDLASLRSRFSQEDYEKLAAALSTLGHTGEGHCACTVL